jgi:EmrB/QacA subfamily drug resistance transporter
MDRPNPAPAPQTGSRLPWRVLSVVLLGTFLGPMGGIIVGVALPSIQRDFGVSLHEIKWVLLIYLLVTTFMLPITGWLGRRFGEGRLFTLGFAIDAIGTLLAAFVPTSALWLLLLLRVVQAVGSALIFALFSALITRVVPQDKRGIGFGLAGTVVGISLLISPPLGGMLSEYASWRWVFLIQVPLQLIGLLLSYRLLPRDELKPAEALPWTSVFSWLLVTSGIVLSAEAVESGLLLARLPLIVGLSLLALLVFVWSERKGRPLFEYALFKERAFALGSIAIFLINLNIFIMVLLIPFYLEGCLSYNASQSGRLLALSPLFSLLAAPLAGRIADRRGYRLPVLAGLLLGVIGFGLLAWAAEGLDVRALGLGMAILGLSGGLINAPVLSAMMGSAGMARRARASSISSLMRNLGFMLGTSIGSLLFAYFAASQPGVALQLGLIEGDTAMLDIPPAAFAAAISMTFWVCTTLSLLALALCIGFPNRLPETAAASSPAG